MYRFTHSSTSPPTHPYSEVGRSLLLPTGGITIACKEDRWTLDEMEQTFNRFNLPYERLRSPAQVQERFPQFRLGEGEEAIYSPSSGTHPPTHPPTYLPI